jgi:prepilin-type N-terminal cleavage/methylation domain-containing protein
MHGSVGIAWRNARRPHDVPVTATVQDRSATRARSGLTVLELLVTTAVLGVALAIAAPGAGAKRFSLWNAQAQLLADLRHTRADALTRGDHFRLVVTGPSSYEAERLQLVGTDWVPVATVRSRTLPSGLTLASSGVAAFEFDTRGLLVDAAGTTTLTLQDEEGQTRRLAVWPSGQVTPL